MAAVESFPIRFERHLMERPDPDAMPDTLMCMDDRSADLYWQIGGGIDGVARDVTKARETERPGSIVNDNQPIHRSTAKMAQLLRELSINPLMHHACAAYENALAIERTIVDRPDEVLDRAEMIYPALTPKQFEASHEAGWRILDSELIAPTEESDNDLLQGVPEADLPAVERIALADMPHQANDMIIDPYTDTLWNPAKALAAGDPAYYVGLGIYELVLRQLAERGDLSARVETILGASAIRHAAISLILAPRDKNQGFLNIHVRLATQ